MKLKQQPEDFQVEEVTDVVAATHGPFALFRLEKKGWTTPDAVAAVRQRWQLPPNHISFGGLKDRHAWTTQHLTIFHGPRRGLKHQEIVLHYLGQVAQPFDSEQIRCNRFRLTLRDLAAEERATIETNLQQLERDGIPNYFDDQRFGSVTPEGGEFIARLLVKGQFEEALKLALTAPYEFDRAEQKKEKEVLSTHWGNWQTCKDSLPRGHVRDLVDFLHRRPGDYRGAVVLLRPELRGLYLSAYQSHLWNRMLGRWLTNTLPPQQRAAIDLRLGALPAQCNLNDEQRRVMEALSLPLPSARLHLAPDDAHAALIESVLAQEGVALREMKVKGVRELFFSRGERAALCRPGELAWEFAEDEKHVGKLKLKLAFELPRGSYATLVVKRVRAGQTESEPEA